jgi:hypothetical protein
VQEKAVNRIVACSVAAVRRTALVLPLRREAGTTQESCRCAQFIGVHQLAVHHQHAGVAQVADAARGIAFDKDKVGETADRSPKTGSSSPDIWKLRALESSVNQSSGMATGTGD